MNLAELNPYIRVAMHSELPAPFYIRRRVIFDYELIYIEDGEMVLTYNDTDYHVHHGDLLLLCPGIPHTFNVANKTLIQPHIHGGENQTIRFLQALVQTDIFVGAVVVRFKGMLVQIHRGSGIDFQKMSQAAAMIIMTVG